MKTTEKRWWRPRFSLRAFFILPLIVGLFFGLGELTRNYGEMPVKEWLVENGRAGGVIFEGPLLFSQAENMLDQDKNGSMFARTTERYYLWALGPVFEIPFTREFVDVVGPDNSIDDILRRRLLKKK